MIGERKQRILLSVINDYIESAEPVGSRTLARKYDLGVSAATIRNEMADLEMLGYLEHLHTSSGRIPSTKGYRFYVNGLLPPKPVGDAERMLIDRWYKARVRRLDEVFKETARLIAEVTHNVSIVLAPQIEEAAFRCLQFLPLDERRTIAVILTDAGFIENKIIAMPDGADFEDMRKMATIVNKHLFGCTLKSVDGSVLRKIHAAIGDENLYESAVEIIGRALDMGKRERLYIGGTRQLLLQPEFNDVQKVKDILLMLDEEEIVKDLLRGHRGSGLTVSIGQENDLLAKDCSLITAAYHLGGELLGTIAVIGPTRMEYAKAIAILDYMNDNLAKIIQKFEW